MKRSTLLFCAVLAACSTGTVSTMTATYQVLPAGAVALVDAGL